MRFKLTSSHAHRDVEAAQQSSEPGAGLTLVHQTDNYGTKHSALSWSPDGAWLSFVSAAPNTFVSAAAPLASSFP